MTLVEGAKFPKFIADNPELFEEDAAKEIAKCKLVGHRDHRRTVVDVA